MREAAFLAEHQYSPAQALAVYDRAFQPLMPEPLVKDYFELLTSAGKLRDFLAAARAKAQADPQDLTAAARIFVYYRQQSNFPAARRALLEYAGHKKSWTAGEHLALAGLFNSIQEYDEAARHYYALYTLPGAEASSRESALGGLAVLLLAVPEQPIRFGAGNLSYYRDIGTIDPYPGFLNGILSLLFNSAQPRYEYQQQDQTAVAYFHRARASDLIRLFDQQFPNSTRSPVLHARLIEAYAAYGDDGAVIDAGQRFRSKFPNAREQTSTALLMASAYTRQNRPQEAFAIYDQLLKQLAARAGGVPLGEKVRSPEYAAVLDRYISRLVNLNRIADALQVYRGELDRNPKDPGLFEHLERAEIASFEIESAPEGIQAAIFCGLCKGAAKNRPAIPISAKTATKTAATFMAVTSGEPDVPGPRLRRRRGGVACFAQRLRCDGRARRPLGNVRIEWHYPQRLARELEFARQFVGCSHVRPQRLRN